MKNILFLCILVNKVSLMKHKSLFLDILISYITISLWIEELEPFKYSSLDKLKRGELKK